MGLAKAPKHPEQKIAGRCPVRRLSWKPFLQESSLVFQPLRHWHPDDAPDNHVRGDHRPLRALGRGRGAADHGADVQVCLLDTAIAAAGAGGEGRQFLQVNARRTLMVRIAFGCAAMTLWFTSLRLLPLGQATALFQSSVIFVTIFSPLMLGERIGIYRWSAVVTGMIGIVLLTNPFDGGFSFNVVFGIGGAMAGAALSILLRRLGKADNPFSIALWYNGTGGILLTMLALTVGVPMVVPDQTVMATLVLLGVVASGLQLCITTAYKFSEAVVVASLRYMQIPLAALVAYLALGETVTLSEVAGGIVVIGSCLFIVWREMKKSRSANSAPASADPVT